MKNQMSFELGCQVLPRFLSKNLYPLLFLFFVGVICVSCDTELPIGTTDTTEDYTVSPDGVHLAFAGGGWRAHTGHSAWTMSLLDDGSKTVDEVFSNVGTISSNSGGSWFSTMLMYSQPFIDSLQAADAVETWSTLNGGWIGGQYKLFKSADCGIDHGTLSFVTCVFAEIIGGDKNDPLNWINVVDDIVYKDFKIDSRITLRNNPLPWAQEKPLLLAASLLKDQVVLNESIHFNPEKDRIRFYQACLDPHLPVLAGLTGAHCSSNDTTQVMPVTFSRIPPGQTTYSTPPFLPPNNGNAIVNLGYKENSTTSPDTMAHVQISNALDASSVPVVVAAATSSAAMGFFASETFEGDHDEASLEAVNYSLNGGTVSHMSNFEMDLLDLQNLQELKIVSLADGGPVDNSGVAQLVSFLQQNKPHEDTLHIVAFDNVTEAFDTGDNRIADVGTDIAYLFGRGLAPGNKFCAVKDTGCVIVPDLQIFYENTLSTSSLWSYPQGASLKEQLIYTRYLTTTVDNPVFNIQRGTNVVLHAFTCVYESASTIPTNPVDSEDLGFKAYGDMLKFIHTGMTQHGGLEHLQRALGVSP